ncbi:MAG: MotA/TolQ/ExbB proton channel family protein [Pseudomonadota bacterium]
MSDRSAGVDGAAEVGGPPAEPSAEGPFGADGGGTAAAPPAEALAPADPLAAALDFLLLGGPAIWAIAALSVAALALILWKAWRLALIGAWSKGAARRAVDAFAAGREEEARRILDGRRGVRSRLVAAAIRSRRALPEPAAREETTRVAKAELAAARSGLRGLELISTIAPLLGLLGTVLGMIAAFQALQEAGARADPAALAGGIWEALLTTAAGMAVAIPAAAALTWFESVIDRIRLDLEDAATRVFTAGPLRPDADPDRFERGLAASRAAA